ncbi:MAG: GNAT family N-acetyltransferase [Albidovulum sp.]
MIPEIETERLILRGMIRADFPAYLAIWQEPEVVRFTGGTTRSESECWSRFLNMAGSWMIEGFGQWAITLKPDQALVGQTGFFNARRDIGDDFDTAPEAGWVLSAKAHGRGYGREAVEAAHRWFDTQPFGGCSHAMIDTGHAASFAIADRLGYNTMRHCQYAGEPVALLRRDMRKK